MDGRNMNIHLKTSVILVLLTVTMSVIETANLTKPSPTSKLTMHLV